MAPVWVDVRRATHESPGRFTAGRIRTLTLEIASLAGAGPVLEERNMIALTDKAAEKVKEIADALGVPLSLLTFLAADPGDLKGVPEDVRDKLAGVAFKLLHAKQRA